MHVFSLSGFHFEPTVIVCVVGIGHVQGIVDNWEKDIDIQEIMRYVIRLFKKAISTGNFSSKSLVYKI